MKVEYLNHSGTDWAVANYARVSFDNDRYDPGVSQPTRDRANAKLIRYLASKGHKSPFYHPHISLRLQVPIYLANQLKRHQVGASINEVSRRYVSDPPVMEAPTVWRSSPKGNIKQGSGGDLSPKVQEEISSWVAGHFEDTAGLYRHLLENGVAPEQARVVLPMGTLTSFIWTGSLYFFANMFKLRTAPDAQAEVREVAVGVGKIVESLFPISWDALMQGEKGRVE